MPDTSRRPQTLFEERIDFDHIAMSQDARVARHVSQLSRMLRKIESATLAWARDNLARKKLRTAVAKFSLPRKPRHRAALRKALSSAAKTGAQDVALELEQPTPIFKISDLSRVRARADALFEEHTNWLETNLKRRWSQAMLGARIDEAQIMYLTRLTFAEFGGWQPPEAP